MGEERPPFIVTLVHGTFAKNAAWTKPGSTLWAALEARFGDRVLIERMPWSGANTFSARRDGAAELRDRILKRCGGITDPAHIVIAHSHAGNIATYAALDPAVNGKIAGVVALATPFIVARVRNLGQTGKVATQTFAIWITVFALYLTTVIWPTMWEGDAMTWNKLIVILGTVLLVQLPLSLLLIWWSKFGEGMIDELQHGMIERERFLIMRAVADEATGAITFAQFPSLATTLVFGALARFSDGYVRWCVRLMQRRFRAVLFVVATCLLMVIPEIAALWLTDSLLVALIVSGVWMCLTWGPFIPLFQGSQFGMTFAMIIAAGPMALLFAPVMLILFVTSLALGPKFALANLHLDVSVEATPVGQYDVILIVPQAAGDPDTPGGMLHSALYDDERAIKMICEFIAARVDSFRPPREIIQ